MNALRVFEVVPEPGELVLSRDGGGWRHFLNGRPVDTGTTLRLVRFATEGPSRVLVRYESRLDGPRCDVVLHFTNGDARVATSADRFERIEGGRGRAAR